MLPHKLLFYGQVIRLWSGTYRLTVLLNMSHRSLSNDEANSVHAQVITNLKDKFGVEIR